MQKRAFNVYIFRLSFYFAHTTVAGWERLGGDRKKKSHSVIYQVFQTESDLVYSSSEEKEEEGRQEEEQLEGQDLDALKPVL